MWRRWSCCGIRDDCSSYYSCIFIFVILAFIIHGHLPADFMRTAIWFLLLKLKQGAPVTRIIIDLLHLLLQHLSYLRSVFLKFWRLIMIINLDLNLNIPPTCAFLLLNACTYTGQNTPVNACLLDASEAFDRVNHWTLFAKLIDTYSCSVAESARFTILVSNATSLY